MSAVKSKAKTKLHPSSSTTTSEKKNKRQKLDDLPAINVATNTSFVHSSIDSSVSAISATISSIPSTPTHLVQSQFNAAVSSKINNGIMINQSVSNSINSTLQSITTVKRTKDILFPIFYEASTLIDDEYWKTFFVDLSKNKLTGKKIHVDSKCVSHIGKKTSFSYNYENKSAEDVSVELKKIISNTLFIYSDNDMHAEREQLDVISSEFRDVKTEDDWKKVKNRKMKDHLITNYVLQQKQIHKLSWLQARQAYSTIRNALYVFRTHKSHDITMNNGNIETIDDIIISAQEITNNRFFNLVEDQTPVKKVCLDKEWLKYCNNYNKKCRSMLGLEVEETKRKRSSTAATTSSTNNNKSITKTSSVKSSTKTASSSKLNVMTTTTMSSTENEPIIDDVIEDEYEDEEEIEDDDINKNDEDDDDEDDEEIEHDSDAVDEEEMDTLNDYNNDCEMAC